MGGFKDYMRGHESGRTSMPSRTPRNFAQWVGYNAAQAQRQREMQATTPPPTGEATGGPAVLVVLMVMGVGLLGVLLLVTGGVGGKLIAILAAVVALTMTRAVRRTLGPLTPIYIGLMIGLIIGCVELLTTGAPLNLSNLAIFLFLGAALGSIGVPIAIARRNKR